MLILGNANASAKQSLLMLRNDNAATILFKQGNDKKGQQDEN